MSALHTPVPASEANQELIREQLERLVASPLFRNSKRSPAFLRYVVEAALNGQSDYLKERTLGIEVFSRAADYDTALDHIVRSTAGDVRRRLAQYYLEPEHAAELRIDIPPGSYVPCFRIQPEALSRLLRPESKSEPRQGLQPEKSAPTESLPASTPISPSSTSLSPAEPASVHFSRKKLDLAFIAAFAAGAVAVGIMSWLLPLLRQQTALDRFWQPVTGAAAPASLCIGSGKLSTLAQALAGNGTAKPIGSQTLAELHTNALDMVPFSDAVALTRVASLLGAKHKVSRVLYETDARLADLRQGPVVLIGAFDNDWTIRLAGPLRYTFVMSAPSSSYIKDRQRPDDRSMSVSWNQPALNLTQDYAIISRVSDPTTEQPVIIAGGITKFGTMAASEFLTDERRMQEVESRAPRDWQYRNVQIVIGTSIINGSSGPPRILNTYFW